MRLMKSTDFPLYRDLCVVSLVRQGASIAGTLRMTRSDIVSTSVDDALYLQLRDQLFPESRMAFPTDEGTTLRPQKFATHLAKMLHYANLGSISGSPKSWSEDEFKQLKFWVERQRFQVILSEIGRAHV